MRDISWNKIKWSIVCLMLYTVIPVQAQVEVRDPIFTEDFGTVPEDWANNGKENDYSDGKNIDSYRGKLDMGGKNRGAISYTFGKREKKFILSPDKNLSLSDVFDPGRYGLVRNGKWVGNNNTWHGILDHTGNENGLVFLTNAANKENSLVFYNTVNKENTLNNQQFVSGGVYQFKIFVTNVEHSSIGGALDMGQKPNVSVTLKSGDNVLATKATGDLRVTTDAPAWTEHILYAEIPWEQQELRYDIISVNKGYWATVWPGNIFAADDISISPVEIKAGNVNVDFCIYPGFVYFEPIVDGTIDPDLKLYSRLMFKDKKSSIWKWYPEIGIVDSLGIKISDSDWLKYDFRVAVGLGRIALENVEPNDDTNLNTFGYYTISDKLTTKEYCLSIDGMTPDYTSVTDSIHYLPNLTGVPGNAVVYSRWMWQPFGGGEWKWMDEAKADTLNRNIDWVTFSTGNFRCTYAFSPELLNMLDCNTIQARELYAVTSDVINGADYDISVFREKFDGGGVNLSVETNGIPLGANVYTRWMQRPRSGGEWTDIPGEQVMSRRYGLVTYSEFEYRVVLSLSATVIRNLNINDLADNEVSYRVSQPLAGRNWELGEMINDYCALPGSVKRTIPFLSEYPPEVVATARWRQRTAGNDWEWMPGVVQPSVDRVVFNPTMEEYLAHDYELVISWSRDSLNKWSANELPLERDYYILQNNFVDASLCLTVDTIVVESVERDVLKLQPTLTTAQEGLTVYGRWLRKLKGSDSWEWMGEAQEQEYGLKISTDDFGQYDYRFYAGLAAAALEDVTAVLAEQPYLSGREIQGVVVRKPQITAPVISCMPKQDLNRVNWKVSNDSQIKSFTYRIGNRGEEKVVEANAEHEFELMIHQDSSFCLLTYEQEELCERIIRNDTIHFKYTPKLHISHFTDEFGCHNTGVLIEPKVNRKERVKYEWYKNGILLPDQQGDTLRVTFEETGEMPLKLVVSADGYCPEDSTVYLITGEYPKITYQAQTGPKELCVGQEFFLDYQDIEADRYRVTLKKTTMPGFVFYPGSGEVNPEERKLEIKSLQTLLTATDFMVGHEFTFTIQIFHTAERNGTSYQCEDSFDYSFRVRPAISSRYPSNLKLCGDGHLTVELPVVDLGGNQVSLYQWRIWDGEKLTGEVLESGEMLKSLDREVAGDWNGKRLQLTADCGCGTVIVQDIRLMVFNPDSNRIEGPEGTVLTGDKVSLAGTEIRLKDLSYQWEARRGKEDWQALSAETTHSISFYAPDTTTEYRRTMVGEGWSCPGMQADPVLLKIFNNERENRIYIHPEDTLVISGNAVTLHSDSPEREDVSYRWEQYEAGSWTIVEGETGKELTCRPENISKYRRVAITKTVELFSNEVVINVYNNEQNRILLANGILYPGDQVKVMGNYVDIPGVKYSWYSDTGEGWKKVDTQRGNNLEMPLDVRTKFVRYVYLPSQSGDSLCSNEVTAYVFDNANDNVIRCENLNICSEEPVSVSGNKIEGEGITYRWEYSEDEGNSWMVVSDATGQDYTFTSATSLLLRRRVMFTGAPEYYSNVLNFNIIHNSTENIIEQPQIAIVGETSVVNGSAVQNASYRWESSDDGENNWNEIEGANGQELMLNEELVKTTRYLRRRLLFSGEAGCDGISNVLKLKVFDPGRGNMIAGPEKQVCQWSEFSLTGSDLEELHARYEWYRNDGKGWQAVNLAVAKDLTVYEGCGQTAQFRRDVTIGDIHSESNIVEVHLWDEIAIANTLKQPGVACAGQSAVIEGSDALAGEVDLSGYIRSYSWEFSLNGAGSTWKQMDSVSTKDLFLGNAESSMWYCRVVNTTCGTALRSEPVLLDVREQLRLTLRHNAPFNDLNPKEPIRISIDEDYFDVYEIIIDGKTVANNQEYLFYGWQPKKDYRVVANVLTSTGCSQTDTMRMRTPDVDLPNVLTPNNDGYNDVLLKNYDLKVYNRWGNLLYSGTDGWDGRFKGNFVAAGTYFYVVRIKHENGVDTEYKKSVTVKRE